MEFIKINKPYFEGLLKLPAELATDWENIIGRDEVKKSIHNYTIANTHGTLENTGLQEFFNDPKKADRLLLYGAPGAGKATLVEGLAKFYNYNLLRVGFDDVKSINGYDARDKLDAAFQVAKNSQPCILFLDEAEIMLRDTRNQKNAVASMLGSIFRAEIKQRRIMAPEARKGLLFVVSTNDPYKIPHETWSKFVRHVHVPELSRQERDQILETFPEFTDLTLDERNHLLDVTAGYAYGDLKSMAEQVNFGKLYDNITSSDILSFAEESIPMLQVMNQQDLVKICQDFPALRIEDE